MSRTCFRLVAWIVVVGSLSGCWSLVEVDRRSFATTIGIDRGESDRVVVTLQIPEPGKLLPPVVTGGNQGRAFEVVSASAGSVEEAIDSLQTLTFRELVVQQNKSIIIGEKAAQAGVAPLMDFLQRSPLAPSHALVFITDGNTAHQILSFSAKQETLPGLQFFSMAQNVVKYDRTQFVPLWLFQQKLHHNSKDPFATLIRVDATQKAYVVSGIAAFDGDRMAGRLSATETQIFGLLAGRMKAGGMTFQNISGAGTVTLRTVNARTRIQVRDVQAKPRFLVKIRLTGSLSEIIGGPGELNQPFIRKLENELERALRSRFVRVIRKLQQYNSDIIDFGEQLRVQQPSIWRKIDWKKEYPNVPFRVIVDVRMLGDGVLR